MLKFLFVEKGYNPLIRPVQNLSDNVTVDFGLAMIQLINVVSTHPCESDLFPAILHTKTITQISLAVYVAST